MPPMKYLTEWRMHLAGDLLTDTKLPISSIAERIGYGSEAALTKAFKQFYQLPPGEVRRQSRVQRAG
ncbi:helix-turn-helix domain-containing protein [Exilibacterium tricleocarpae]|uniref:Helix-turn-helix domain-containing protein n=2 Tax=Exilibacterium tricleocarpae TaxID=2591008 RepID=A0A545TZ03_9GAMM|nr:helix-turn-helix domain-containing protein [Exilibacterium tricleocarpae]